MHQQPLLAPHLPNRSSSAGHRLGVSGTVLNLMVLKFFVMRRPWKRFGQEVRCPHAGFHRAERMFDGLPPLPHGLGVVVEAPLYLFQNGFMLPARNPPLLAAGTASSARTAAARIGLAPLRHADTL